MQTIAEILAAAKGAGSSIAQAAVSWQARQSGTTEAETRRRMAESLEVMRGAVRAGLDPDMRSVSGKVGGQAAKMRAFSGKQPSGMLAAAGAYAMAVAECNACMGKIVAAPTAGSCGILPGALFAAQEDGGFSDEELTDALFTAAAVGRAIASQATISGAEGGCQAECGSAAAMTAAALTTLYGGTPDAAASACALALMNTLGLVCDPVGGLVEIPCVYRNVGGVAIAVSSALMALSGVACPIPADEVILAMKDVGEALPPSLRETGEGGCAGCASCRT